MHIRGAFAMRIVLDTNILVSGLLHNGKPRRLIDLAIQGKVIIVSSVEMIDELKEVLSREKFGLSKEAQVTMMDFVIRLSNITVVKSKFKAVRDPTDDMVINTAHDGNAAYIVTGDKDLLELEKFGEVGIIKASKMLKLLGEDIVRKR
ncbi:PilT domain-containing protein [mine drainage metagenome]|uniref:PilT domain-containing protein n=1 Tax=mine drainage metagenome TaxID=410659 RepID=T1BKW7_9ZZZZ